MVDWIYEYGSLFPFHSKPGSFKVPTDTRGRGEPPEAMSLRYADTSLPDLLGRPSLRYTVNEPPLYSTASL